MIEYFFASMKKNATILLFLVLAGLLLIQVNAVKAVTSAGGPISGPATSPITGPTATPLPKVTPTITPKPISYFSYYVGGKVTYRYFRLIRWNWNRFNFSRWISWTTPAANVKVEITSVYQNGKNFGKPIYTKTNWLGNYSVKIPAGDYRVKSFDQFNTVFNPSYRMVSVIRDRFNISFEGIRILY